jgi:hypothetical protein
MTVAEGVALWTSYMKRIAAFGDSADHAIHLRFTDLIDDWRRVVGAVSSRLNLALDLRAHEARSTASWSRASAGSAPTRRRWKRCPTER